MFYHRKSEIEVIHRFFSAKKRALLVYGKRRVGKTTLIKEAIKDYDGDVVYFQCTSETYENNLSQLVKEIREVFNNPWLHFDTFYDLFKYLTSLDKPIVIVFDEYNELKESYGGIEMDSAMQKIIDSLVNSQVRIILSGSSIAIMAELLNSSNPLFGRFHSTLKVKEFDYFEASSFVQSWTTRDKITLYSIFGGSPAVLEEIDVNTSLEDNIKRLLIDPKGNARLLVENTLLQEFNKIGPALSILSRIGNGKMLYSEINDVFDPKNTGALSKWLNKMISNDLIEKTSPINDKKNAKRSFYRINDNILRFYFTYVYPNRSRIEIVGSDAVFKNLIMASLDTYISYRFEEIAKEYFSRKAKEGKLEGIVNIGSYWYDDKKKKRNGEFDIVLEYTNGYDVFEVKFLKGKMSKELAKQEEQKIIDIESFKARNIGFISLEGFDFTSDEYLLIDGDMLFE